MTDTRRIVLFGGSGFVGSRLTPLLLKLGHDVVIADIADCQQHPALYQACDLRDPEAVRRVCVGKDLIINLAAQHRDDVTPISLYEEVNVQGSRNVCRAAEGAGIQQIIFTSSVAVYGFQAGEVDETFPARPFNEYGRTKWEAEGVYREWLGKDPAGRSLTVVRPTVIFGEGNRGNVYNLLSQIAGGRFLMVGNGRNRKSMAYVENVAGFLAHCLNAKPGEQLYNYVDKPDLDMNTLVGLVRRQLGRKENVVRMPYALGWLGGLAFDVMAFALRRKFSVSRIRVKKFCAETVFTATRAASSGYAPPFSLRDSLERTVQYEFRR